MKIQFDSNLDYQDRAINSIVEIFEGQEICQSNFSVVSNSSKGQKTINDFNDLGIGNRLELLDDEILANVQHIQLKNGLPQSKSLDSMDFSVEMETGRVKHTCISKPFSSYTNGMALPNLSLLSHPSLLKRGRKRRLILRVSISKGCLIMSIMIILSMTAQIWSK